MTDEEQSNVARATSSLLTPQKPADNKPLPPKQADLSAYREAASLIPCDLYTFRAVCLVESMGHGFDNNGFPVILVEPHIIWKHATIAQRNMLSPFHLAYPRWGEYTYGTYSEQKSRFDAITNKTSLELAILGTSFGLTQILGENFKICGFPDAESFYKAMCVDERQHLYATALFMRNTPGLSFAMRASDFAGIARYWNGPANIPAYASKLRAARLTLMSNYKTEETAVSVTDVKPPTLGGAFQTSTGTTNYIKLATPDPTITADKQKFVPASIPGINTSVIGEFINWLHLKTGI